MAEELASVANLEEVRKEENRKLQRDRKLFEQHAAAARAIPDKKEREEIQVSLSLFLSLSYVALSPQVSLPLSYCITVTLCLDVPLQSLRQELASLQEEMNRKESRWGTTHGRLRQQIDSLNMENAALKEEVWLPCEPLCLCFLS